MGVATQLSHSELFEQSNVIIADARTLAASPDANAESHAKVLKMIDDAKSLRARSKALAELEEMTADMLPEVKVAADKQGNQGRVLKVSPFKSYGEYLTCIWKASKYNEWDPRLKAAQIRIPGELVPAFDMKNGWMDESKAMTEAVGADGGFGVFPEYRSDMFQLTEFTRYVRGRALVIPMRARQIIFPALDQTGSTAGIANMYGGVVPTWTEEATSKTETQPSLRQLELIAHKLALYSEASDELLADSAIGLVALLTKLFGSAIANEEEWTFINGTGAGQPLGINHVSCNATYRQTRAAANAISIVDVFNMLSHFMGQTPIWLAHQSTMPQILQLNGPAGNASYVWIGNGRDQMPTTLMGYPIFFIENTVTLGSEGDLILADWSKYVIGDRQATTIETSKHFKFQSDLTAWRAIHRVAGRPWLSTTFTLRDGTTEVSPFVILDDGVTAS